MRETPSSLPSVFLALLFGLVASIGVVSGGFWGGAGIGGALLLALMAGFIDRRMAWPNPYVFGGAGLFLCLSALTVHTSSYPDQSIQTWMKMASILLPLCLLSSPVFRAYGGVFRRKLPALAYVLAGSFVVLSIALLVIYGVWGREAFLASKFNRGLSYGLLLAFAFGAGLAGGDEQARRAFRTLLFACCLGLVVTASRASQMAALLALCAYGLAVLWPRGASMGLGVVTSVAFLWPWAANPFFGAFHEKLALLPASWRHRMEIWDYLSARLIERPWTGWGIGSTQRLDYAGPHAYLYQSSQMPASHPHNAAVQLWVEMGLGGAMIGFLAALAVLALIAGKPVSKQPWALGAYTFGLTLLMTAYNLWTDSLWAAMALTILAFSCAASRPEKQRN